MSTARGRDAVADVRADDGPAGTVQPDAVEPDAVEPDAVEPDAVEPDAVQPDAVQPDVGGRRPGPLRTVVAAVLALLFLVAAVALARHGIVTDTWPGFLPDTDTTSITRYRGPWLTAAAVAVLGAGLSIMAALRGLRGRGSEMTRPTASARDASVRPGGTAA